MTLPHISVDWNLLQATFYTGIVIPMTVSLAVRRKSSVSLNDSLVESGDLYFIVQAPYQYFHHI